MHFIEKKNDRGQLLKIIRNAGLPLFVQAKIIKFNTDCCFACAVRHNWIFIYIYIYLDINGYRSVLIHTEKYIQYASIVSNNYLYSKVPKYICKFIVSLLQVSNLFKIYSESSLIYYKLKIIKLKQIQLLIKKLFHRSILWYSWKENKFLFRIHVIILLKLEINKF